MILRHTVVTAALPSTLAAIGQTETTLAVRIVTSDAEGFPEEIQHALKTAYVPIAGGAAQVTFDQLAPGRYAVTVYNDANDNGRFDKNWLGMPREAWGVSNNPRPRLRAPRFDEAMFQLDAGAHSIEIRIE